MVGEGGGGSKAPPVFFLPKNSFFWPMSFKSCKKNVVESGGKECIYVC